MNDELKAVIAQVAEVAGYLWQNGWAERNGGNITVNITELTDDALRRLPALAPSEPIGKKLPHLKGKYFYAKGTGKRMRDLARRPMENGAIIRICDDCESYEIIADAPIKPTSELPSHLALQDYLIGSGSSYKATLHTHPIELVALSHIRRFLQPGELTRVLWSMIPETLAFAPLPTPRSSRYAATTSSSGRNTARWPSGPTSWTHSTRPTCCARRRRYTSQRGLPAVSPRE